MTAYNGGAAGAAAGAAAAIANAIKASGVLVRVTREDFKDILERQDSPLVVRARGGFFQSKHKYLTSYKGLAFYTLCAEPISLSGRCEIIEAKAISIPG